MQLIALYGNRKVNPLYCRCGLHRYSPILCCHRCQVVTGELVAVLLFFLVMILLHGIIQLVLTSLDDVSVLQNQRFIWLCF